MCRRAPLRRNRHWPSYIQQGSSATNIQHGGHATCKKHDSSTTAEEEGYSGYSTPKGRSRDHEKNNQVGLGDKGTYCSTPRIVLLLPTAQHNTRFYPSKPPSSGNSSPSTSSTSPADKLPTSLLSLSCPCPLQSSLASRPSFLARC